MGDPNIDTYTRFVAAYNDRDIDRMIAEMHPEIEFHSRFAVMGGVVYTGHAGVRGWFADLDDAWERLDVLVERVDEVEPDLALALITLDGEGRGSGLPIRERTAHRLEFAEAKLRKLSYVDREEAAGRLARVARPTFAAATFDCYGTLVDWEGGLGTFLYSHALRCGNPGPPPGRELRERWEEIQFGVIQGEYRPYREVLAESLRRWCAEHDLPYEDADGEALVRSMRSWQPFPDTVPALTQAAAAGLDLVILSNTDRDIISHTLRQIGVDFTRVIVAEDVRSYKPAGPHFERALEEIGEPPERILHVAFGFKYDIGPAQAAGMAAAWVNRHAEEVPGDASPDFEWRDLWGLAELVGGPGPGTN